MSNKQGLAMLIVCNIVFLFVYLVRTIMWLNGESDRKYLSYLFKNNDDILPININTICFICFNGLALLIISTMLISCIL